VLHETLDTNAKKQEGSATTTVEATEPQSMQQRGLQGERRAKERQAQRGLVEEEPADRKIKTFTYAHASGKYLGRQAAGQQRPNDGVLRLRRKIQGMNPG